MLQHRQLSWLHSFTERRQITLLAYSHAFSQIHQCSCQGAVSDISINQTDRMSETGVAGYAPVKTPTLNTDRNKPLHELSYKELQNMCMGFNLPANLKVSVSYASAHYWRCIGVWPEYTGLSLCFGTSFNLTTKLIRATDTFIWIGPSSLTVFYCIHW